MATTPTVRTVKIVLADAALEAKEAALEAAVADELEAETALAKQETKLSEVKGKVAEARAAAREAADNTKTLLRECFRREAHAKVTCSWQFHEATGLSHLHRNDTGEEVQGEPPRPATAEEKTMKLALDEPEAPAPVAETVTSIGTLTVKDRVREFFKAATGAFDLDAVAQHVTAPRASLRRILGELTKAGELASTDDGFEYVQPVGKAAE